MYITEKGSLVLKYLLNSERPEKIGDISKNMNISVKSFRSYLKEAEAIASEYGGSVAKNLKEGIWLTADYEARERMWSLLQENAIYLMEPKARRNYIIDVLLETDVPYTIQSLSEDIGVTKNVITKDMEAVEEWFKRFEISVVKRPGVGIQISGAEMNLRQSTAFFNRTYDKNWIPPMGGLSEPEETQVMGNVSRKQYTRLKKAYPQIPLSHILHFLLSVEDDYGFLWTPEARGILLSQICVLMERTLRGRICYLPQPEKKMIPEKIFECSRKLLESCSNNCSSAFPEEEIYYIAVSIMSAERQYHLLEREYDELEIFWKSIASEAILLVSQILKKQEICGDEQLHMEIAFRLQAMSYRTKYNIFIENMLLADFKKHHASLFGACWAISPMLENYLGIHINENEIVTIALLIGASIRQTDDQEEQIRAVIVGWNGMGMKQYISEMVENAMKGMKVVKIISYSEALGGIPANFADIILCIDSKIEDSRCIQIAIPLTQKNIYDIELKKKQLLRKKAVNPEKDFISPQLIWPFAPESSMEEIIQDVCGYLCEIGYVTKNYVNKVTEREKLSSTCIGKGIAIPHALDGEEDIICQCIMVVRLQNPVRWGNKEERAELIFFLVLHFSNIKNINYFFENFYSFLNNDRLLNRIKGVETAEEIAHLLNEGEEEA